MLRRALVLVALGLGALVRADDPFLAFGPYDPSIPTPTQVLGEAPGTRITTYFEQERYLQALATAAPTRVKIWTYGQSTQKRGLRLVAVGDPEYIANLETLRADYQRLADGKKPQNPNLPSLVWVNQTIHGDEAASFESGMWLMYNLAASQNPRVAQARKGALVVVNPCYNPDGHERFAVWYNSVGTGSPFPGAPEHSEPRQNHGRTNHYRFDMNRDRVSFSQAETIAETAEYRRWNPHVYIDQHGEVETYFFPPVALSVNVKVDRARYEKWTDRFGRAKAKAFDARGWNYFIRDTYDFYFIGFLDINATLNGAIGMTHETDAASVRYRNEDGTERTLAGAMAKHFHTAMATIESAAEGAGELKEDFRKFREANASYRGEDRFITLVSPDPFMAKTLATNLTRMGLEFKQSYGQATNLGTSYWPGAGAPKPGYVTVIDQAQPLGALARAMFDPKSEFEPEFIAEQKRRLEAGEGFEFYDMTGWALPYLYSMSAWRSAEAPKVEALTPARPVFQASPVGYAVRSGFEARLKAFQLQHEGFRLRWAPEPMKLGDRQYPAGTLILLAQRNDPAKMAALAARQPDFLDPLLTGYPEGSRHGPGSENIVPIQFKKIGVAFGSSESPTAFGATWYLFEQVFKIPFTPMTSRALAGDLSEFSTLVLPSGRYEGNADRLKAWVQGGGCLVLLGHNWGNLVSLGGTQGSTPPIPGAVMAAEVQPADWLTTGIEGPVGIPVDGSSFYRGEDALVRAQGNILSGWKWDNSDEAVAGSAFVKVESLGSGHVVWFAQDPTERAMWPGLWPLFVNALYLGGRY